jgi:protein TonB
MSPAAHSAPAAPTTSGPPSTGLLQPPRPLAEAAGNRPPVYPERARQRREQGQVTVRVEVSADGTPLGVAVAVGSGYATLDEAALDAVRAWRFVPAMRGSLPVVAVAEVPIRFRLAD